MTGSLFTVKTIRSVLSRKCKRTNEPPDQRNVTMRREDAIAKRRGSCQRDGMQQG